MKENGAGGEERERKENKTRDDFCAKDAPRPLKDVVMRCIYAQCLRILDGTIIVPSILTGPLRDAFIVLKYIYAANMFGDHTYHEN